MINDSLPLSKLGQISSIFSLVCIVIVGVEKTDQGRRGLSFFTTQKVSYLYQQSF